MTQLRKRVFEELERRNYSQPTARSYVGAIRRFAEYFDRSPELLGPEHIRFRKVLRRRYSGDDLPLPELLRRQVPIVLSRDEVARLIDAAPNLRHRTILMARRLWHCSTKRPFKIHTATR